MRKNSPLMMFIFTSLIMFSGLNAQQITDDLKYPKLTTAQQNYRDASGEFPTAWVTTILQNAPHLFVSSVEVGGATSTTVDRYVAVAPTKLQVLEAKLIITKVQTGTGNRPIPSFVGITATDTTVIALGDTIELAGAIGDVYTLTVTTANATVADDTKLCLRYKTPAQTITVPIEGKLEYVWKSVP